MTAVVVLPIIAFSAFCLVCHPFQLPACCGGGLAEVATQGGLVMKGPRDAASQDTTQQQHHITSQHLHPCTVTLRF